jgi:hypothetical protein
MEWETRVLGSSDRAKNQKSVLLIDTQRVSVCTCAQIQLHVDKGRQRDRMTNIFDLHFLTSKTRGEASGVLLRLLIAPCSRGVVGALRGAEIGNAG